MPYEHDQVIRAQYNRLAAERARAHGDYEAARLDEDADATMYAADRIVECDAKLGALNQIANTYIAGQSRAQAANKYGLSKDEVEVAHGFARGDRTMTNEQREATYAQNKDKLRHMRATGQYRDDQGVVRR